MKIQCLVENVKYNNLVPKHGVCFYIETSKHKILFDLGPDDLFFRNANLLNIDISKVDTVIISHGHVDHGGGLRTFLSVNNTAKIYVQRNAFDDYYTKVLFIKAYIGLDQDLKNNKQIVYVDNDFVIDDELSLWTAKKNILPSPFNRALYKENNHLDDFSHEQSLLVKENKNVLFTGCSHHGVFNILDAVKERVDIQIGGFHLCNPVLKKYAKGQYLEEFKNKLKEYDNVFYTCHCTGIKPFTYLSKDNSNINYFYCGMSLEV